ncbi:MAG TPA: hypothetical protein VGC87_05610 [Pyrinomonadaceae bacterium]|jgi:hypothetical protein
MDLFQDPTPNGLINQRYVQTMIKLAELTDMKPNEKEQFINLVLLVGKKLAATWKHYNNYATIEDQLIKQAEAGESLEKQPVQRVSYSQDLFLEMDEFLVQFKSTLDYLVKLPVPLVGRRWNLNTFGERGGTVRKALKRNLPKEYARTAKMVEEQVLDLHKGWLEMAIEARDRLNHLLEGGADFRGMLVIKMMKDGKETVHVPLWDEQNTARHAMEVIFYNLLKLVEDFSVGFLTARLRDEITIVHKPVELGSVESPWRTMPLEQFQKLKDQEEGGAVEY